MNIAKNADEICKKSSVKAPRVKQIREHLEALGPIKRKEVFDIAKKNASGDQNERQLIAELLGEKLVFEAPKAAPAK